MKDPGKPDLKNTDSIHIPFFYGKLWIFMFFVNVFDVFHPRNGLHALLRQRVCRFGARFRKVKTLDHPREASDKC